MSTTDRDLLTTPKKGRPLIAYYNPQYNHTVDFKPPPRPQQSVRDSSIYEVVEPPRRVPPTPAPRTRKPNRSWKLCNRLLWVLPLLYTQFWIAVACAIVQYFFPSLATTRAVEEWKNVYVNTAFTGAMLIGSVISERLMVCMTAARLFICSHGFVILCTLLFGCLYWSPGGEIITGIAIGGAAIGGLFLAFYLVSMYTVTTEWSKGSAGIAIAVMLCVWKAGYIVGPILGDAVVKLWMYPLPFFACGGILFLSFLVIAVRGPVPSEKERRSAIETLDHALSRDVKYRKAFLDSLFLIDMATALLSAVIISFNETTLKPHLQTFTLTTVDLETTFTVQLACYGIGALTVGVFSYFNKEETCLLFGQTLAMVAYFFLGPVPFLEMEPSMWRLFLCQVCIGLSTAAMFVASFSHAIERLYELGYPETTRTTGFVSCVFFTFLSIGIVSTPPLAQHLVDTFGYRLGSMPLLGTLAVWWIVIFVMWVCSLRRCCKAGRRTRLTSDETASRTSAP
ncbi:MFS-type transporter SLC18B1-like isoform X2 [Ornithodoros turicata]|uniref:MFS-type transporter SLC18B1-like isoform X2 n=1 Tax=Ornithodoros turicata TaxID=34597 RepID=UPI003139776C